MSGVAPGGPLAAAHAGAHLHERTQWDLGRNIERPRRSVGVLTTFVVSCPITRFAKQFPDLNPQPRACRQSAGRPATARRRVRAHRAASSPTSWVFGAREPAWGPRDESSRRQIVPDVKRG
jgi:hypothetical protein